MNAREIIPDVTAGPWLAGAQFVDAYRVELDGSALDAREAAHRMFSRPPRWIEALLRLRNLIVAPLGLKTSGAGEPATFGMIGIFPVVSETPERLVAGSTTATWIFVSSWTSHPPARASESPRRRWCERITGSAAFILPSSCRFTG
jgi:hypothetical protein